MKVLQRLIPADCSVSKFGVTVQLMFPFDSCDHCVPIGWVTSVSSFPPSFITANYRFVYTREWQSWHMVTPGLTC